MFWCPPFLVFWGRFSLPGGGDVEYFGNYSFLVADKGVGNNARSFSRPKERSCWRDGDLGVGGGKRGSRLHLRGCSVCGGTPGTFMRQPSREGRWRDFLAVAVFVFWLLRDSVLAPNGCSPLVPKFYFILPMVQSLQNDNGGPESGRH